MEGSKMEGSKMEGSKMKCGGGVKEGQSENTGEGGWCCSTNKYGVVSPTSNYLCTIIILYFSFISLYSHCHLVVVHPLIGHNSNRRFFQCFFIQRFFSRHPYLLLSVSAVPIP